MKLQEPFHQLDEHISAALPGATALFTTRRGGFSTGPYATLNLGRFTDDDPQAVERNRELLESRLAVRFAYGRQAHGSRVALVAGATGMHPPPTEADGQATSAPEVAPMVLTADCLPIALAGDGAIAMLHAGWRGLAAGIVPEGVRAVRELGGTGPIAAAIGPGAGVCCYEVGEDVHAAFSSIGDGVRRGRNLDLKAIARHQLAETGVQTIHDCALCTICSERSLFFSHRRERGVTGRQAGIVWLS